jgi:MHS family proline/betaine transporter-like MFS transporter
LSNPANSPLDHSEQSARPSVQIRPRVIVAVSIGNALEWFDYAAYGYFASTLAKVFFPAGNETTSLLLTFAVFGVTFIIRPLGAIVIGSFADRYGRRPALALTILLMTIGTAMIGFAPTYATVGIIAPLIVVVARVVQGFSAGGEFGSATAFLAEQHPMRRGYFASWQFSSQGLTSVLATVFGIGLSGFLSADQLESWGWRIPFLFGLLIGPVAYYIRHQLEETNEFKATQSAEAPVEELFLNAKASLIVAIGIVALGTVAIYAVVFMPTYAVRHLGLPLTAGYSAGLLAAVIMMIFCPLFGALSDIIGRIPIAGLSAVIILVSIYPLFAWLSQNPTLQTLLIFEAGLALLIASYAGVIPALLSELFAARIRTTGLSISYSIGVAVFGGLAPFINETLIEITGSKIAPSYYLILAAAISLTALITSRRLGLK